MFFLDFVLSVISTLFPDHSSNILLTEVMYIRCLSPDLCAQNNFVLALSLFSPNSSPLFYAWLVAATCS